MKRPFFFIVLVIIAILLSHAVVEASVTTEKAEEEPISYEKVKEIPGYVYLTSDGKGFFLRDVNGNDIGGRYRTFLAAYEEARSKYRSFDCDCKKELVELANTAHLENGLDPVYALFHRKK